MLQGIPGLIVAGGVVDADVQSFLAATGITDATISSAIRNVVLSAKAHGWWTLCSIIYPMVGGTSTTCKYNLKDPRDLDAAFRNTFNGSGWTFSSTGASSDGSAGTYGDTNLNPTTVGFTQTSIHLSYYDRTNISDAGSLSIMLSDFPDTDSLGFRSPGPVSVRSVIGGGTIFQSISNTDAYWAVSTNGTSTWATYKNGVALGGNSGTAIGNQNFTMNAYFDGSANGRLTGECAFATIGTGVSATLAATMYTDIQAFQTALSRNV